MGTLKLFLGTILNYKWSNMIGAYRLILPIRAVHQVGPCNASGLATFVWPFFERTNGENATFTAFDEISKIKITHPSLSQERWKTGKRLWRSLLLSPTWPGVKRGSCCEKAKGKRDKKRGFWVWKETKSQNAAMRNFTFDREKRWAKFYTNLSFVIVLILSSFHVSPAAMATMVVLNQ